MPKIIDHEKMTATILEQSHQVFAKLGYQAVSMRRLAQEIGVTTGVLYHYFPNKKELLKHILAKGLKDSIEGIGNVSLFRKSSRTQTLSLQIQTLFQQLAEEEDASITNVMLLTDFFRNLDDEQEVEDNFQVAYQFLDSFRDALGLDKSNEDRARFIMTYLLGVHLARLWTGKRVSWEQFGELLIRFAGRELDQSWVET